ncbi:MAG: hypothetical protein LQ350_005495 [Teloschistes chrysophthalmus]|nr:MAG: hypothetical protein LQ350_005495 [Niorma chrysophthalma]
MSNEEEAKSTQKPEMDLQLSRVFVPEGGMTHIVRLTNQQYHDLVTQYMFVSNRRFQFLSCAGRIQTYLARLARSTAEKTRWVRLLADGGEARK